ncbi:MAG: M13 family metallopeptidase [Acidobacteriota bacterium]
MKPVSVLRLGLLRPILLRLALLLVLVVPRIPIAAEETASTPASAGSLSTEQIASSVLSSMDLETDPCVDFYQYACGGWLESTELPADQTRWARSFSVIGEGNRELVREILEDAAEAPGDHPERQLIGSYYASCMDAATIEKAGVEPLAPLLAEIAGVDDAASLLRVTGKLHRHFLGPLFSTGVFADFKDPELNISFFLQGGLGMPDRDYYVTEDEDKRQLMVDYEQHIARMFVLLGDTQEQAGKRAADVVAFETRLAESSRPRDQMRIIEKLYNKIDRAGLDKLTPGLPWSEYFKAIGYPDVVDISVATPEFFEALEQLVADSKPSTLQSYLRWHLVDGTTNMLSQDFVDANFEFYGQKLQGQREIRPRWKRCVGATESALGQAIGKIYVEQRFAGASKDVALEMVQDIEDAFKHNLPELGWMDDVTRQRAVEKAQAVGNKIGYPDTWRDYSRLDVERGKHFANAMAARAFEFDRNARKIGKPIDPDEWLMTPQMVNAYYTPLQNEIVFPAGILQPPFFHRDFPAAMNYGGIGAVIGHELSHGFDDQGRKFDPQGQLRQWWEEAASEQFQEQAQCVEDLYSGYEVEEGVSVNGKLTLGENIADIGGVKQAFEAYKIWQKRQKDVPEPSVEGLTHEQLFFVAYGQVWCSLATDEQQRLQVTTDTHSPGRFRVLGPVSNNRSFAEAFSCAAGTPMNPKEICEVW